MQHNLTVQLLLIGLIILVNAFFVASEVAIVSVRRSRLRQLAEQQGSTSARVALGLLKNPSRFLATIQIGATLAGFFVAAIGAIVAVETLAGILAASSIPLASRSAVPVAVALVTVAIAFVTLVLGELVPKNLAVTYAERIALTVAWPVEICVRLMAPLVFVLKAATNAILFLLGSSERAQLPEVTEDEIRSIVDAGEEEGVVEPMERRMIQSVFDFAETKVHEVMTPRTDVVAVEITASADQARQAFVDSGYSRVPVYRQSLDDVVGVLYAKDLLQSLNGSGKPTSVRELTRPPMFVPESKMARDLLVEFQRSKTHMAIVVDEYGGTGGIVTLEDLLEEIVGEIHDEYDVVEKHIEIVSPNEALVDGRVTVDDLNEALGLALGAEEADTVGGLILAHLGRIPNANDVVELNNVRMAVLSVHGRRVKLLRVTWTS